MPDAVRRSAAWLAKNSPKPKATGRRISLKYGAENDSSAPNRPSRRKRTYAFKQYETGVRIDADSRFVYRSIRTIGA